MWKLPSLVLPAVKRRYLTPVKQKLGRYIQTAVRRELESFFQQPLNKALEAQERALEAQEQARKEQKLARKERESLAKDVQNLIGAQHTFRKAISNALSEPAGTNRRILREIMYRGASLPSIMGRELDVFAQCGEDLIVDAILQSRCPEAYKERSLRYLDIGANHPINTSNTYSLYQKGFRGVLVEPIHQLAEELRLLRPEDTVLELGVGTGDQDYAELNVVDHHEISSLSSEFIEDFINRNQNDWKVEAEIKIELIDINMLLEQYFPERAPDVLDIDVEALDFEILNRIDFKRFRPLLIIIEPSDDFVKPEGYESNSHRICAYMKEQEYFEIARTRINQIFCAASAMED